MTEELTKEQIEENLDQIAANIKKLSIVGDALSKSELNEKTVIWLLSRASGVNQREVKEVLYSMYRLEEIFLKPSEV